MANDTPRAGQAGARTRPFWLIGLVVLGFVALVLAAAFLLDRQFRAPIGTQTAAVPANEIGSRVVNPAQSAPSTLPWQSVAQNPLEREVEDAFARYWRVRAQAYLDLNHDLLTQVMAGNELQRETEQLLDLKRRGRAGRIDAEHHITFREVSANRAVVYDEYLNKSVLLDASTKQPISTSEAPNLEKVLYELTKVGGVWKVVDGALQD